MRIILTLFLAILCINGIAQDYSIKNKKAIKTYEEAVESYNYRNFELAMTLLDEAIAKESEFVEAYILYAQVQSETDNIPGAIAHLEKGMTLNNKIFPGGYCTLGEMYLRQGEYEASLRNFQTFIDGGKGSHKLIKWAHLGIESCRYAIWAMQHPVDFNPINLGEGINTEYSEYYPCLTADEKMLLFTRVLPTTGSINKKQEDFFISEFKNGLWTDATGITEINSAMNEGAPSLSHDGQVLIFTACEIDGMWGNDRNGLGSCDLFFSQKLGNHWSSPLNLGEKINSYYWESQPSIAADGRTLYFVRGKSTAHGVQQQDIWVSHLGSDGYWQKAKKVEGYVNTEYEEESVLIHPDGETMYFSSNGHPGMGGLDIFMSKKQDDGSWGEPLNLGFPINTHGQENSLLVSASGDVAFFASDREGGFGGLDLYSFNMPESVKPNKVTYVKGVVFDALSFKKLQALFEVIDLESGKVVSESLSNVKSGEFLLTLPVGRDYALNASKEGYLFYSMNFSLMDGQDLHRGLLEIPMEKIKAGSKVVLNNIFFMTGEYSLRDASQVELKKLTEFLLLNKHTRIEIGGHTDNVGSESDNVLLSQNRAGAVVKYLVDHGVEEYRLVAKGYGESRPMFTNDTVEGRRENRRTEFMIVE